MHGASSKHCKNLFPQLYVMLLLTCIIYRCLKHICYYQALVLLFYTSFYAKCSTPLPCFYSHTPGASYSLQVKSWILITSYGKWLGRPLSYFLMLDLLLWLICLRLTFFHLNVQHSGHFLSSLFYRSLPVEVVLAQCSVWETKTVC